ncbi:family 78 glycoside hydrolase catalytic domain [Algibacter sp. 2305UL17-15]|uniref:family 78 glycoside hydrolase catalytic domain n=1 Tax=Algibacter sp. 2305UL17-15 TaxID=3231268 RepID=UPI0034593DA7
MHYKVCFLLVLLYTMSFKAQSSINISQLTVEYLSNPIGIHRISPLMGWKLFSEEQGKSQSAYQVLIASSKTLLKEDHADIFNTGKIKSSQNINHRLSFSANKSNTFYYWKVKIWDEKGDATPYSNIAFWKTGLLNKDDWDAKWISNKYQEVSSKREPFSRYDKSRGFSAEDSSAVYLRKQFKTRDKLKAATTFVTGLGYYELYLNGQKVGDHVLDPVFTDYQKNVKYLAYDVTSMLEPNKKNTVSALLGNGFYNHTERDLFQMEKANWKTPPKFLCQIVLEYESGAKETIISDTDWKWSYGPIVYNSIRGGETIDARIDFSGWNTSDFDHSKWQNTVEVPAPLGKLTYQYLPPMREVKTLKPDSIWSPKSNVTVFDFGENLTGYADVTIKGDEGKVVDIYFNEALNPDGSLNLKHSTSHTFGRFQHGKLILSKNETDAFKPRFTYHGFRYVQIEGVSKDAIITIEAKSVHTDLKETSTFQCSNPRLNQLHQAVKRTLLNSVHGMPGEEATREKMGWTYDGGMNTMESYLCNFDAINTFKKYLDDLIESQEDNGHVPPIVPTNGWGFLEKNEKQQDTIIQYDDPWWGGTLAYVAQELYESTGDTAIIKDSYKPIKDYTSFVMKTAKDDIVYWSLGDWLDLEHNKNGWGPGLTSVELTSTAGLYYLCDITAQCATMLGNMKDAQFYSNHAKRIKEAFNKKFLDEETGWYDKKSQTGQAVSLYYNLVPETFKEKATQKLMESIEKNNYHTSVGFIGVRPLIQYLSENGYKKLMYRLLTQEESPGWLHFVKDERSTMGENLNAKGYGTNHHPFATNIGFWLFEHLSGVKIDFSKSPTITLNPGLEVDVQWVKTSQETLLGNIVNHWEKKTDNVLYHIELPVNANAELILPDNYSLTNREDYSSSIQNIQGSNKYMLTSGSYNLRLIKKP